MGLGTLETALIKYYYMIPFENQIEKLKFVAFNV